MKVVFDKIAIIYLLTIYSTPLYEETPVQHDHAKFLPPDQGSWQQSTSYSWPER